MSKKGKRRRDAKRPPVEIDRNAEGKLDPRSPPYGYRVNELGEWEQVPDEIAIIRQMAEWRLVHGASYPTIAERLNADGISSPKGGEKGWSAATVWRILRNTPYWRRPNPALAADAWAAMRAAKVAQITGFLGDEFPSGDS
jgi:hypothetical protein